MLTVEQQVWLGIGIGAVLAIGIDYLIDSLILWLPQKMDFYRYKKALKKAGKSPIFLK